MNSQPYIITCFTYTACMSPNTQYNFGYNIKNTIFGYTILPNSYLYNVEPII